MSMFRGKLEELDRDIVWRARTKGLRRLRIGEALDAFFRLAGHQESGFANMTAYAAEQLGRTIGWVKETRKVATRARERPLLRAAFVAGEFGWSKLELVTRYATAENEAEMLVLARTHSVRELRHLFRDRQGVDGDLDEAQQTALLSLSMLPEEDWLFEACRRIAQRLESAGPEEGADDIEWIAAEAFTTLMKLVPSEESELLSIDVAEKQRLLKERLGKLADARDAEEARVEPLLPLFSTIAGEPADDWPLPTTVKALDAFLVEAVGELTGHDVHLGRSMSGFLDEDGPNRLGYANLAQWSRERVGISYSSMREDVSLAHKLEDLPLLTVAACENRVNRSCAMLVARVATPETERAWVERAARRTFKHLRDEIRCAESNHRMFGTDLVPPTDAELADYHEMESGILSGEIFQDLLDTAGDGPLDEASLQMSVRPDHEGAAKMVHRTIRVRKDVQVFWRQLEKAHAKANTGVSFPFFASIAFIGTWLPHIAQSSSFEEILRRDRYQCSSPVCFRKLILGPHHVRYRAHGGGDDPSNLTSPCDFCHLLGEHLGRLKIRGRAPDELTWIFGREPVLIVRGRERRRVGRAAAAH